MIIEKCITTHSKLESKEAKVNATMYPHDNRITKNTKKFTSFFFKNIFNFIIILNCMKVGTW
jgi:hypothetical protein